MTIMITKEAVVLYDIDVDTVWERMSQRRAEAELRIAGELGDPLAEYFTSDRDGNPLRVVALTAASPFEFGPSSGVYVFDVSGAVTPAGSLNAVVLYDVATKAVFDRMSPARAASDLAICRELGDTVVEYDTTDRSGRPLRVVLQVGWDSFDGPDVGGVYEFAL